MKDQNRKNLRPERPLVSCAILIFDQPALLSGHLIHYFPLHEQGGAGCIVVRKRLYLDADDHQSSKAAPFLASRKLCKSSGWSLVSCTYIMLLTLFWWERSIYTQETHLYLPGELEAMDKDWFKTFVMGHNIHKVWLGTWFEATNSKNKATQGTKKWTQSNSTRHWSLFIAKGSELQWSVCPLAT